MQPRAYRRIVKKRHFWVRFEYDHRKMTDTAKQLREIVGQETEPPLWIYVTKDQVPILERAASDLDGAAEARQAAFVAGTLFGAYSMQGRHDEAAAIAANFLYGPKDRTAAKTDNRAIMRPLATTRRF